MMMISNSTASIRGIYDNYDLDPFHRTEVQKIAIATIPKISGGISFLSSAVMIFMILQSEIKLSTPFRRLIFAMCIIDLCQSGVALLSTLPSPIDTPGIWGAQGNAASCSITGFIFFYASSAAPLYMCSLCVHYLCFVQYKVTQKAFRERIEPFLHIVPNVWCLATTIFLTVKKYINQADVVCWIAPVPYNCIFHPEIECVHGKRSYLYRWIFSAGPNALSLLIIGFTTFRIYHIVKEREEALYTYRNTNTNQEEREESDDGRDSKNDSNSHRESIRQSNSTCTALKRRGHPEEVPNNKTHKTQSNPAVCILRRSGMVRTDRKHTSISERSSSSYVDDESIDDDDYDEANTNNIGCDNVPTPIDEMRHKRALYANFNHRSREARKQAFLFVGSFTICYIFVYINVLLEQINIESPYVLRICVWFFFPLQGFFNIYIFTRPHVVTLMQKEEEFTRFQALWKVIRSGGDVSRKLRPVTTGLKRRSPMYLRALRERQQQQQQQQHMQNVVVEQIQSLPTPDMHTNTFPSLNNVCQHVYPGPSTIHSWPMSHIRSNNGGGNVSSLGIDNFDNNSALSSFKLDEDLSMYGDNDYDIYDDDFFDDDRLSFHDEVESQASDLSRHGSQEVTSSRRSRMLNK